MKNIIKNLTMSATATALTFCFAVATVPAQQMMNTKEVRKQQKEGRGEAREAAKVFREIMNVPDKAIPRELLDKAEAIGVFPNVVKAGFIVGGRGGDGVVSRRTATGWSAPVFYNVGGASFGAQIGAKKTDYIMLFMNEGALRDLLDDKLEFEGDLSFAAGPIGRTVGAGTNLTADAGILVYSRSKGAFIGASIGGAVLTADNSINEAFYNMKAHEVLENPAKVSTATLPRDLTMLNDALMMYSRK
ncbi:MAG: lipid-binding SYLF domain-containing protein [Acidobacteriota bacterium]|nr:lipid-binding SYLF domain-containing protein [Acidobacteriota bacterium]